MARVTLQGIPISPGIAIGPLQLLPEARIHEQRLIAENEINAELEALNEASRKACASLEETVKNIPASLQEYGEIVASQLELARDPRILKGARARIRHKKICAAWAIAETIAELAALFQDMDDPYLKDRAHDIYTIGKCLADALNGVAPDYSGEGGVLAAWDISPASVMDHHIHGIRGLITVNGGTTSHSAILARALKAPAITGVTDLFQNARHGDTVIVDGMRGIALLDPDEADLAHYTAVSKQYAAFERDAREAAQQPAITRNGVRIDVLANLDSFHDLNWFSRSGAEGVGLYRTEFSYLTHKIPDEEALVAEYKAVLAGANGMLVIFRTLDIGADKIASFQEALHEPNPALGLRGIRFCFKRMDIFRTQLRAMLRAGHGANMAIMLPMITTLGEVREVRAIITRLIHELAKEGSPHCENPPLGIMLETPAAVLIASELAQECDFLSLGTNDLLHYLMAIDRNNRLVSYLHNPLHPAFLRAIAHVCESAHKYNKKVCVCGELAADPMGMAILIGLGVDSLSVTPRFAPAAKHMLRQLDTVKCQQIAESAVLGANSAQTRQALCDLFSLEPDGNHLFSNSLLTGISHDKEISQPDCY